jgi:hypothetical protein
MNKRIINKIARLYYIVPALRRRLFLTGILSESIAEEKFTGLSSEHGCLN